MTRAQKHMARVANLGCILSAHLGLGFVPAEIHHLFDPSQRSDWLIVPLSPELHRGPNGFHGLGGERPFSRSLQIGRSGIACNDPGSSCAMTYLSRDSQLVRVETDELEPEGINRGDWIVLDKGVAVGVIRAKKPRPVQSP